MKILVTGSQGTLGIKLIEELQKRGHDIWGCDIYHGENKEIRADVSEWRQVERAFEQVQPEVCYHLAAEFGRNNGQHYYEQLWKSNCLGTRNVIEACIKYNTHLIFASSSEAYGSLAEKGELFESLLDNEVPSFHNEYALSKWTNEQQIKTAINNNGLRSTILRFFNVYGPGEFYNDYRSVVSLFIYRALKKLPITVYSKTYRSFLYINDWSNAVANVIDRLDIIPNGASYNIGSPDRVSLLELFTLISNEIDITLNSDVIFIDKENNNIVDKLPHTKKSENQLGLTHLTTLKKGIKQTVAWMKEQYV